MMVRVVATPAELDAAARQAAAVIAAGGIVAIPTDTLYALAANPFDEAAVARLFAAKGRPEQRAIPLVAADRAQVARDLGALPTLGDRLASRYWPGPLTLLIPAGESLAPAVSAGTGRVGVRVPAHAVTRAVCTAAGYPLTATSANRSGEPATDNPDDVARTMGEWIEVLVDSGRTPGGPPSTIVDVAGPCARLVRAGAIPWEEIEACAAGR